ncbi:MAG: DUF1549 domain-containing protein [Verrucomicrobiota bacterium]|nr:DUF1549 domain-containing protein [Verrucomicrobiota bacterium]
MTALKNIICTGLISSFILTCSLNAEDNLSEIDSITLNPTVIQLDSPFANAQVIATAKLLSGDSIDVTRLAKITVQGDSAKINETGFVEPLKDGNSTINFEHKGKKVSLSVKVQGQENEFKPDYVRDIMPVISRMGCNQGTCHGSKDGKNGFKLSLRGYDPIYDIRAFTDDLGGRRVNAAAPDSSLLLLKATGAVPHEGGQITKINSDYYNIVKSWISGGAKLDLSTPKVKGIEVFPKNPVVQKIGTKQQIRVVATYHDGLKRDVTREAFVQSGNTEVAEPEKANHSLITTIRRGEAPILIRYEGNYTATTVTVMGDRSGFVWQQPPANNKIDELVASKWERMKILPSGLCDDYEFVRRAYLDITGLPPSAQVIQDFVSDNRDQKQKRDALIDQLIGSEEYTDHWTNKWADLLQVNRKFLGQEGAKGLREWIRMQVKDNKPYDQFVREIITATGSNKTNPAASYYKILREPDALMENTTHLFLATRFNCNKCHDHPFERWTQDQYYELAAYFAQVDLKRDPASGKNNIGGTAVEGAKPLYELISDKKEGEVIHDRTKEVSAPSFPYSAGRETSKQTTETRRAELADWITAPGNQYFASSYVNRLWGYMLGTGIIEPLDDIRAGNPPSNPELLKYLEQEFIKSKFNIQHVLRLICKSRTYQLSIQSNKWNDDDATNFSHGKARRLPAEVLYDTIYASLGAQPKFPGVPPGTRAAQLPDVGIKLPDGFLDNAGRPVRESACECERSSGLQLGPIMALVSGPTVGDAISDPNNVLPKLINGSEDDKKVINEIFLRLLSRPANEDELTASLSLMNDIDKDHEKIVAMVNERESNLKAETDKATKKREEAIATAKSALAKYREEMAVREEKLNKEQGERIAAAEKAIKDFEQTIPEKVSAWAKASSTDSSWEVINPIGFNSTSGSKLELENDSSLFASGKNGVGNYRIFATTEIENITGVRIEAIPDSRLPKGGPGRSGNFVLTEFELHGSAVQKKEDWEVVKLWTFDQSADGWEKPNQAEIGVENGVLKINSKGNDPSVTAALNAPAGTFMVDLKAEFPGQGKAHVQLFWTTKKDNNISEERSTRLTLPRGKKGWQNYRFFFQTDSELTSLRFDPIDDKNIVYVDAMRINRAETAKLEKFALENAKADFSQDGYGVNTAIDGQRNDSGNGWAISPQINKPHTAIFEVKEQPKVDGRRLLKFDLDQRYKDNNHSIGRFRISVTSSPKPINFGLPGNVTSIIAKAENERTEAEVAEITKYYKENNGDYKKLNEDLANAKKPRPADPKVAELEADIKEAEKPIPEDYRLAQLRKDATLSEQQKSQKRITAAQDIAWAIINTPAFLFNR